MSDEVSDFWTLFRTDTWFIEVLLPPPTTHCRHHMRVVPRKVTTTVKVQQGETQRKSKKGVIIRADLARLPRATSTPSGEIWTSCARALETFLRSQMRHAKFREKGDGAEEGRVREGDGVMRKIDKSDRDHRGPRRSLPRPLAPVTIPRTLRLDA